MVEIRVLGKNRDQVEAWFKLVADLVREGAPETGAGLAIINHRNPAPGREGDFIGYIRIRPPLLAGQIAAPRLPRKARLSAGRRRRASG